MEWQVVTTIVVLVGLIVTIATPMIKLNSSIVKLTDAVSNLKVFLILLFLFPTFPAQTVKYATVTLKKKAVFL